MSSSIIDRFVHMPFFFSADLHFSSVWDKVEPSEIALEELYSIYHNVISRS